MGDREYGLLGKLSKFKKIFNRKMHPLPLNESMVKVMEYGYRYNYLLHNETNQMYPKNEWVTKRIIWIILCRLSIVLYIFRLLFMLNYSHNETIRMISADFIHKFDHGSKFALIMIGIFIFTLCLLISFQYMEMMENCPGMRLIHLIATKTMSFRLGHFDEQRVALIVHLFTKYVIRQVYGVLMAFTTIIYLYLPYLSYSDPEYGSSLFWEIIWFFPGYLAWQQIYGRYHYNNHGENF